MYSEKLYIGIYSTLPQCTNLPIPSITIQFFYVQIQIVHEN